MSSFKNLEDIRRGAAMRILLTVLIVTCIQASAQRDHSTRAMRSRSSTEEAREKITQAVGRNSEAKPVETGSSAKQTSVSEKSTSDSGQRLQSSAGTAGVSRDVSSALEPDEPVQGSEESTIVGSIMSTIAAIIAAIVAFIVGRTLGRNSHEKSSDAEKLKVQRTHESEVTALKDEMDALRRRCDTMRQRMHDLEEEKQKETPDQLSITIIRSTAENDRELNSATPSLSSSPTEYLSTPDMNGEFDDSQRSSSYRMGVSAFRIDRDTMDAQIARIVVADRPDAQELLLRRREDMLEPVAQMTNAYRSDSVGIIVEQPGEVELLGNRWRIRQKIIARYQ